MIVAPNDPNARQQYDQALAKWHDRKVLVYEMDVQYNSFAPWAGTWTLRVSQDHIDVVSYAKPDGTPATPTAPTTGDTLRFLTVEGQLAAIEHRLTTTQPSQLEALVDWTVSYDQAFGYPVTVLIAPKPGVNQPNLGNSTTIKGIRILKYATGP